jgi:hypothetical protein
MTKKIPYKEQYGFHRRDYYPLLDKESKEIDYFDPEQE